MGAGRADLSFGLWRFTASLHKLSVRSKPCFLLLEPLLSEWPGGCAESLDHLLHRLYESFLQGGHQDPSNALSRLCLRLSNRSRWALIRRIALVLSAL